MYDSGEARQSSNPGMIQAQNEGLMRASAATGGICKGLTAEAQAQAAAHSPDANADCLARP